MITLKVTLEYDGSRYRGWQEQKNARTIMGELRKAARELFREEPEMQGSGRTDAGVHALGQVMHVRLKGDLPHRPAVLLRRWNELLPADIAVLGLEPAARNFHARHAALSRSYLYQISDRKQAFLKRYVWWIKDPLDVEAMRRAAVLLPGRRDMVRFRAEDPSRPDESTIVVVEGAAIAVEHGILRFRIEASHFIWKMVRRIVGALVEVGGGRLAVEDFGRLVEGGSGPGFDPAAWTAPAAGLFLEAVRYPDGPAAPLETGRFRPVEKTRPRRRHSR